MFDHTILRKTLPVLLALVAITAIFAACAGAESMKVYTATDNAAVYDDSGKQIGALPANTELTLTGVNGQICRVELGGKTAYMRKSDLTDKPAGASPTATPEPTQPSRKATAYVSRDGAKVYDAGGNAVGTLAINTEVTVTGVRGRVCQISMDGKTGYMDKADLSASKVAADPTPTPTPKTEKSVTAYVCKDGANVYDKGGDVIATLPLNTKVSVTAVKGEVCRVKSEDRTGYMHRFDLSAEKTSTAETTGSQGERTDTLKPARGRAKEMDWWTSDIQTIFARGVTAQITDVETGLTWREKRFGGDNHADCQPLTAADTAAMKKAYGGTWSWNRRAVFVTINGVNYAASINGMPHGSGSIKDNNFNGHHCIHFTNSRTHSSNKVCQLHQAAIKKAAAAKL